MVENEQPTGHKNDNAAFYNQIMEAHVKVAEAYPKTVLLLAGGSLTLSVTFWEKVVGPAAPKLVWALGLGWFLLAISVSTILLAMLLSLGLLERAAENFEKYANGEYPQKGRRCAVQGLNIGAALTLLGGLVALVAFAAGNIREGKLMTQNNATCAEIDKKIRKDSFVLPTRPPVQQTQPSNPKVAPSPPRKRSKDGGS